MGISLARHRWRLPLSNIPCSWEAMLHRENHLQQSRDGTRFKIVDAAGQIGEEKVGLMSSQKGVICGQQCGTKDSQGFPSTGLHP